MNTKRKITIFLSTVFLSISFFSYTSENFSALFKDQQISCPVEGCDSSYAGRSGLKSHIKKKHPSQHSSLDLSALRFYCPLLGCSLSYTRKDSLGRHIKKAHNPSRIFYYCDQCHKKYEDKASLRRHKKIHNNPKGYKCPFCGKGFNYNWVLQGHKKTCKKSDQQHKNNAPASSSIPPQNRVFPAIQSLTGTDQAQSIPLPQPRIPLPAHPKDTPKASAKCMPYSSATCSLTHSVGPAYPAVLPTTIQNLAVLRMMKAAPFLAMHPPVPQTAYTPVLPTAVPFAPQKVGYPSLTFQQELNILL